MRALAARRPLGGPEIAAELPEAALVAAVPSMLPSGWICGVDDVTPNTAHLYTRSRAHCAALEVDVGRGCFAVRDLEAGARELSARHGARVILWDEWDTIFFVELEAGAPTARLERSHAGDYHGIEWRAIVGGAVPPPFPAELMPLFEAWRDAEFVEGLRRWQHGTRRTRGERVAQIFRRYLTREASPALRAVVRAALRRARSSGSALLKGFGRLLWRRTGDGSAVAVRPARSLLRFFDGGGGLAIDFSHLESRLGAGAVAQAERDLEEALTAARDATCDVVIPGMLCITTRRTPAIVAKNPRDGAAFTVPGHLLPFFIFEDDVPAVAAHAPAAHASTRA